MNRRDFVKLTTLASITPMFAANESEKRPSNTEVYLTIDDGWHYKRTILEIAEYYKVPLNMFIIGKVIEQDPALWVSAMDRGHLLGSHTYNHHKFSKIDTQTAMEDFRLYKKNMVNRIGRENFERIKYFRYPYGDTGNRDNREDIKQLIEDNGWKISWWDMDLSFRSSSYGVMPYRDPRDQLKTFEHNVNKNKNVLLFHFKAPDFQAIELVIRQGLEQGFKFGKLSDRNTLKSLIVS